MDKEKAMSAAQDAAVTADYIANAIMMKCADKDYKTVLNVPLTQLEDQVKTVRMFVNSIK